MREELRWMVSKLLEVDIFLYLGLIIQDDVKDITNRIHAG